MRTMDLTGHRDNIMPTVCSLGVDTDTATPGTIVSGLYLIRHTYILGGIWMDAVWIRLNVVARNEQEIFSSEQSFLFGNGGIVSFNTHEGTTTIVDSSGRMIEVEQDADFIMDVLRKIRGTEGRLDAKQERKTTRKRKAPKSKAPRKV